ncbi:paxneb protein [Polychaeton citri CBS 116435]|uniref:Elongator complex protein 4 n=1 Tax=Polychaeton citri CBS 116435 TaxID=1314669 RepID=A0A9P4Q8J8_9PEZI|nr:paxneb protein [Polychaeton citri CBS 116435]
MAFRKRNIAIGRQSSSNAPIQTGSAASLLSSTAALQPLPGVRPSPLSSSQLVTSTGASSLDGLLGGHAGLALGSSLLIEESGTTDFAGALLRYYAAEGICQGQSLHIVGVGEHWLRDLPGVSEKRGNRDEKERQPSDKAADERMKIAWRYERLGQAGERALPDRSSPTNTSSSTQDEVPFNHAFDLTKRLPIPNTAHVHHISIAANAQSPLDAVLQKLHSNISSSSPNAVHRIVVPTLLSPALYPPSVSNPSSLLRFLHSLRSLLKKSSSNATAIITLPIDLYPRSTGLVRWAEILSDGVLELTPFPHLMDASNSLAESGGARSNDDQPQGMVKVHKLPITTERGEGGAGAGNSVGEDLAFTISRRKFAIAAFSLPPLEGDQEAQKEAAGGIVSSKDVEF